MNVKELIEFLKTKDPTLPVRVLDASGLPIELDADHFGVYNEGETEDYFDHKVLGIFP